METPPKLPAVAPPTVWPTQQKVTDLAERLDRLYPQYQAMRKSSEKLETATTEWSRKKADMCGATSDVRYVPIADIRPLFDHLIGAGEQIVRNCKAERLGGLEIDNNLELGRPLYRQIARLRALHNLVDERSRAPEHVGKVHPISHQAAIDGEIGPPARRQTLLQSERGHRWSVGDQHRIVDDHERADTLGCHRRESSFELGGCAHVELVKLQLERLGDTTHFRQDRLV